MIVFLGLKINISKVLTIGDAAIRVHNPADGSDPHRKFMGSDPRVS